MTSPRVFPAPCVGVGLPNGISGHHGLIVLAIRNAKAPLTARESLRELLHDDTKVCALDVSHMRFVEYGLWNSFNSLRHDSR